MSFWFDPMVQTVGMPNIPGPAAGPDPFSAKISAQQINQQNQLAGWNQTNQNIMNNLATQGPGSDYGKVHLPYLTGSFGPAAAAGTYSPGSGRSSFSGTPLGNSSSPSVFDTGAPGFNDYGGGADIDWMLAGSQGERPSSSGGIGSDAARVPNQPAITPQQTYVGGFDPYNPSTFAPAAQKNIGGGRAVLGGKEDQAWVQGGSQGARPSGGLEYGGSEDQAWVQGGSQGERPSIREGNFNDIWSGSGAQGLARDNLFNNDVFLRQQSPYDFLDRFQGMQSPSGGPGGIGSDALFGGQQDIDWMQKGSQDTRPSSGSAGRDADMAWMLAGSQGPRPSASMEFGAKSKNAPSFLGMYDWGTSFGTERSPAAVSALQDYGKTVAPPSPSLADRFGLWAPARNPGGSMDLQAPGGFDPFNPSTFAPAAINGGINGPRPSADASASPWAVPQMGGDRNALAQALMNRGNALDMPSGQFGGPAPNTFGAPSSGYLGVQNPVMQDPFSGYVNPRDLDAGGSFPGDYAPRFNTYGNAFNQ